MKGAALHLRKGTSLQLRKPNRLRRPKLIKSRKEKRTEYPRFNWKRPSRRYENTEL